MKEFLLGFFVALTLCVLEARGVLRLPAIPRSVKAYIIGMAIGLVIAALFAAYMRRQVIKHTYNYDMIDELDLFPDASPKLAACDPAALLPPHLAEVNIQIERK